MMPDSETLQVEMFPASHGDAFLLRYMDGTTSTNMLIDAGLATTYRQTIKPRLQELAAAGEALDLFIITHVDSDHIEGALDFIADNGPSEKPNVITIRDVWHNSYRHLPFEGRPATPDEITRIREQTYSPAVTGPGEITSSQGTMLAALLRKYGYPWNRAFSGHAVAVDAADASEIQLGASTTITILSPAQPDLKALAKLWRRELLTMGIEPNAVDAIEFESAFEARLLASFVDGEDGDDESTISAVDLASPPSASTFTEDRSVTNGSSIAVLIRCGKKTALFLGDAHPSRIASQLRASMKSVPLRVDITKISHHGSKRNTSPDLLTLVQTPHCLISTNGSKHGHPDLETLLWIVASQPAVTLHFNYPTPASNKISRPKPQKRYGHSAVIEQSRRPVIVTV